MAQKILGAAGWAGIAVVAAGMVARFVVPERQELWWWTLVAGLALVLVYGLGQWRSYAALFQRRQARYGTLAASGVVLGLAILVAANYILARQNKRWDLTAAQQYSLSDQTVRVLESLESPIRVLVFAQEVDFPRYRDRLGEYEYTSDRVSLELIDVDKNPVLARQYEVQAYGTVVFDYNGRIERVVSDQEQDLTNGLIKAVEGEERKAYFLQGHGERSPTGAERDGYSALADALRLDNLSVETVILSQAGAVPEDAAVLVAAGPATDLLPAEADMLRDWLEGGGKLLVLLDPPDGPDAENRGEPDRPDRRMGHRGRPGHRRRRQRRRPAPGHRRHGAGGLHLPAASHHRPLRPADGVPAGALRQAGGGRRRRAGGNVVRRDVAAELGREQPRP